MNMTRVRLTIILLLCLAGAWISGELIRQHADPDGGGVFARICHATHGAGFGCAGALRSSWSRFTVPLPLPGRDLSMSMRRIDVPVAFAGLAYFVFMGVWFAVAGGRRAPGRPWHRMPLHVGLCAVPVSVLFVGIMALGAAPWCLWCVIVHAINMLLVGAVWRFVHDPSPRVEAVTLTPARALTTVATALIMIGGFRLFERAHVTPRQDPALLLREHAAQPLHEFPLRPTESVGEGHHRLVVFTDFECPACFCNAAEIHDRIVGYFDGRIDLMIRHYPLSRSCNDDLAEDLHPNACEAARAAEAARLLGGEDAFRRMYRHLFLNRDRLGPELYRTLAARLDLDPAALVRRMDSARVREIVEADVALGRRVGVRATPAMFLDGRRVTELCRSALFWQTVAATAPTDGPALASSRTHQSPLGIPE